MMMNRTYYENKNAILKFNQNKDRPIQIMKHRKESCSAEIKNQWLYSNPAYIKQEYDMKVRTEREFKNTKYECNLSNALKNFERNLSKYFKPNENTSGVANDGKELSGINTQDSRDSKRNSSNKIVHGDK